MSTAVFQGSDGRPIINSGRTAAHSGFKVRTQAKYDTDGRYILRTGGTKTGAYIPLLPKGSMMTESMQSLRTGTIGAVISDEYRESFGLEPLSSREGNDEFVPIISNVMGMAIATGTTGVAIDDMTNEKKHRERMASVMCDLLNYGGIIGDEVLVSMENQQAPRVTETQLDMVNVGSVLLPMDPGHNLKVFHPLGKHIVTDENTRADGRLSVKEISVESFAKKMINDSTTYDRQLPYSTNSPGGLITKAPMNSTNLIVATKSEKVGHLFNAGMAGVLLMFLSRFSGKAKTITDAEDFLKEYIANGNLPANSHLIDFLRPDSTGFADDSNPVDYCKNNGLDMLLSACAMRANADRPVAIATQVKKGGEKSAGCHLVDMIFSAI